jgi:asparagine synthase (glutamine-hydrolysing)
MLPALAHRGPDDSGVWNHGPIALGHTRLSVIDLESGHQPMFNEDGSVAVVFNGEIYNFAELRADLEARGHRFATRSDTEVLVHLYEDRGPDMVSALRGMFAFAIWDVRARRLLLARDRFGIKPLYWYSGPAGFGFASELSALERAGGDLGTALDPQALELYFALGYIPAPLSISTRIRKLPPGHVAWLDVGDSQPTIRRYWDLRRISPSWQPTEEEALEVLREGIDEAVRIRLVADVPLGAFLSGGVDSSLVVASMRRVATGRVRAFSIGFSEATYDELSWAKRVAQHLEVDHEYAVLTPDVIALTSRVVDHLDEPLADSSALPMLCVSELARRQVTVALSGDGGDELFGGYHRYARQWWVDLAASLPGPLLRGADALLGGAAVAKGLWAQRARRVLGRVREPYPDRYVRSLLYSQALSGAVGLFDQAERNTLDFVRKLDVPGQGLSAMQRIDALLYLPSDILTKVDRMTMAVALEARVPLLDHVLAEKALSLVPSHHARGPNLKRLLKKLLEREIPHAWVHRPKQGFAVPLALWLRRELREAVHDELGNPNARIRAWVSPPAVEHLLSRHEAGEDLSGAIWSLVVLERWLRRHRPAG